MFRGTALDPLLMIVALIGISMPVFWVGEIDVPALLVGGRYDECRPSHLEEMHRRITGSQLAIIEDASHLCFAEQPQEFMDLVNTFLDRLDAAG